MEIEKKMDKIYGNMRMFGQHMNVLAKTDGTNERKHVFFEKTMENDGNVWKHENFWPRIYRNVITKL
jgi:hypothetical protein